MLSSLPMLYTVPGLGRVTVPAAVVVGLELVPGQVGPITFRFPSSREVTGLLVLPALGTPEALASVYLEIVDEDADQVFTDHVGNAVLPRLPFAVPCTMMAGRAFHPFPMQRIVRSGDRWLLTLKNPTLVAVDVAAVSIHTREIVP